MDKSIHKLETTAHQKNIRSIGNLLKNGYEMHDTAFIDDQWHNEYIMEKILDNR